MDFKGLRYPRLGYELLSVIDDATRFCLALRAVSDQSFVCVWETLWDLFGTYGLPECVLCDNGSAFRSCATPLPSRLEMRLLHLGVRVIHGRPYHPQTQGKVDAFTALCIGSWEQSFVNRTPCRPALCTTSSGTATTGCDPMRRLRWRLSGAAINAPLVGVPTIFLFHVPVREGH